MTGVAPARVARVVRLVVFGATLAAIVYLSSRYGVTDVPADNLDPDLLVGERILLDEWGASADRLERGQFVLYDAVEGGARVSLVGVVACEPGAEYPPDDERDYPPVPDLPEDGRVPGTHAIILNGAHSRSKRPDSRSFGPVDVRAIRGRILGRLPF